MGRLCDSHLYSFGTRNLSSHPTPVLAADEVAAEGAAPDCALRSAFSHCHVAQLRASSGGAPTDTSRLDQPLRGCLRLLQT